MRAARMRKYEAFHGTGQSLSGQTSSFSTLGQSTGMRLGGSGSGVVSEEEEKNQEPKEAKKPSFEAFQGSGRRLR
jgi:hypothetical protein